MDSFESLLFSIMNSDRSDVVGRDTIGDFTIDTCYTADAGYETAVWRDDGKKMIIITRYSDRAEALIGHTDWVNFACTNPTGAWSVQTERYKRF